MTFIIVLTTLLYANLSPQPSPLYLKFSKLLNQDTSDSENQYTSDFNTQATDDFNTPKSSGLEFNNSPSQEFNYNNPQTSSFDFNIPDEPDNEITFPESKQSTTDFSFGADSQETDFFSADSTESTENPDSNFAFEDLVNQQNSQTEDTSTQSDYLEQFDDLEGFKW